jgi:hypothetical protein
MHLVWIPYRFNQQVVGSFAMPDEIDATLAGRAQPDPRNGNKETADDGKPELEENLPSNKHTNDNYRA